MSHLFSEIATSAFRLLAMTPVTLTLAAVLAMGMLSESWAKECNCGEVGHESDCCWEIDSNGVLHITAAEGKSEVRMADYVQIPDVESEDSAIISSTAPWANSGITKAVVGDGIGYIGSHAFSLTYGIGEKANSIKNATDMNLFGMDLKVNGFTEVSGMQNVTEVGVSAFQNSLITEIELPSATILGSDAFNSSPFLVSVDVPNATTLGLDVFTGSDLLERIYMPNVVSGSSVSVDNLGGCSKNDLSKCSVCTNSSREGYDATKSVYKPSGTAGVSGTCVTTGSCGEGYTEINGLCKKNSSSGSQVSESDCYNNGQVYYNNACVDEFPFAKKHWTPAEAAQYLKDTDNEIIMTFKVNR